MTTDERGYLTASVPEDATAAVTSANEQIQRERRDRFSRSVIIITEPEYQAALVRSFYKGIGHGAMTHTRDLRAQLSRESERRLLAEQRGLALQNEINDLKCELRRAQEPPIPKGR